MVHCLKCGLETEENQSFCQDCLLDMSKHPVDPNAVVLLPRRESNFPAKKTVRRRAAAPEDRIHSLKRWNRVLILLLVLALLTCGALVYPTVQYLRRAPLRRGQNYTSLIPAGDLPENMPKIPLTTAK